MNPMQGSRNTGGSSTEADAESVYSTEITLNSMLNPGDNPGRPTYASSSSHGAQNHNWWRSGESSSISGPSDQVKTNHQLPQDGAHHQLGLNGMMVHGGVHAGSHMRNRPSFLRGSSSNPMPQHANMSMNMDSGAQTSGVVIRDNNCGSSLGSSIQVAGESSSGPASSLGGWGSSCKRKALEGAPSHSFSGGTQYSASSSLSLATPSQTSPNLTNQFGRTQEMFAATNGFHSARNTETLSRPSRRLDPRQPQEESVAFSISHPGSAVRPTGSPFVDPLPTSITSGENQTNIVHLPALTRNIHQFASRATTSSGIGMPAERFGPPWETPRSNPEQPVFPPATDTRNPVQDQSIWGFTRGSSIDSPFVPRAALQPNPTWIAPQSAPLHNPSSEISPWSLFPSIESQSAASHGPLLPTGPSVSSNEVAMQSGSNSLSHRSRQRRSGLLSERQNDLLHLRHLGRSLAAGSDGRNQLISEIRQVLSAMRRGENLRIEDYMVLDPLIYQGMSERHDRHREMRLDVDNMSYEELLALGERIGDVSTGLKEEVILKTMEQHKHTSSAELHQDMEPCCICQQEYAVGDDLGTLECRHEFHKDCIKQWVMLKNLCPICKTVALTTS